MNYVELSLPGHYHFYMLRDTELNVHFCWLKRKKIPNEHEPRAWGWWWGNTTIHFFHLLLSFPLSLLLSTSNLKMATEQHRLAAEGIQPTGRSFPYLASVGHVTNLRILFMQDFVLVALGLRVGLISFQRIFWQRWEILQLFKINTSISLIQYYSHVPYREK